MAITVKFPNNEDVELEQGKPVVILGANGSGKTRLSLKIEETNDKRFSSSNASNDDILIHRITAQKSLRIPESIALTDYDSSHRALFLGYGADANAYKRAYRYENHPTTHPVDDFDKALAFFFAEENKELQNAHKADKLAAAKRRKRPKIITTVQERATEIWNELLPLRKIDLSGSGVHAKYNDDKYHGKEMSDGERVMLYMICQALILPENSIIIIDEPELHIHKAIVKKLWDRLEQERSDCVFMYITHDLDFAASRDTDKILWVKSYNGTAWEYEFLNTLEFNELSEELLFEIIGTRRKVLFVEGERNSYDHALYNEFYKDKGYHIIPCGGCSEVLRIYKAKKAYEKLNNIEAHCIIDRDFRAEAEITALKADGVNFLEVAEVENLFVIPALLDAMGKQFGCTLEAIQKAKEVIVELFNNKKAGQIGEAFIKEVNHQLTILNFKNKNTTPAEIQNEIISKFSADNIQSFFDGKQAIYNAADTLEKILKIFNFKELRNKVGSKIGVLDYPQRVITLLKANPNGIRKKILEALNPYMPDLP
jgi:ABC-type lipoprotein export system ATPase subunit